MLDLKIVTKLMAALGASKGAQLYIYAKSQIGSVKSGKKAPIAYGCAEAVNAVFAGCFGQEIGGGVSTTSLYQILLKDRRFLQVTEPTWGDIIISPTGYGHGALPNGHVGIVSEKGAIMSNNSENGCWDEHLNMSSWYARYVSQGGYPMLYFRVIL